MKPTAVLTFATAAFGVASAGSTASSLLSAGKQFVQEKIGDLTFQSSGIINAGCNGDKNCFAISLADSGMDFDANPGAVDPSSRQRVEFLTDYGTPNDNQKWHYTWKSQLEGCTKLSPAQWLHTWQLFSDSGAFMKQTATGSSVSVKLSGAGHKKGKCSGTVKYNDFVDKVWSHDMTITYGNNGQVSYTMKDDSGKAIISCQYSGYAGSGKSYLKAGVYRSVVSGMSTAKATISDFTQEQLK